MTAATRGNSGTGSDYRSSPNGGGIVAGFAAVPRLLVSVRSREEAEIAMAGGADILDIKEPSLGSLGMASMAEITSISQHPGRDLQPAVPLSVALGELADWSGTAIPTLPAGIHFAKLGLSRCSRVRDWVSEWLRIRAEFDQRSNSKLHWVAVAYADVSAAAAPSIRSISEAAIETGCAGLLIDTWTKDGRNLLDEVDVSLLSGIAETCHKSGLFLALAGRLSSDMVPALRGVGADVLAIRSAGCRGSNRTSELDSSKVTEFRHRIHDCHV